MIVVAVMVGGALGALCRYLATVGLQVATRGTALAGFPLGTPVVNVAGSLALAFLVYQRGLPLPDLARAALATGFLGSLTTFSTFAVEGEQLVQGGRTLASVLYLAANLVLGYGAVLLGRWLALRA